MAKLVEDIHNMFKPLLEEMGAERRSLAPLTPSQKPPGRFVIGRDRDRDAWKDVDTTGGILRHKGKQITLNIYEPHSEIKFHVTDCKTIKDMKAYGKFERYIADYKTEGNHNLFSIRPKNPETNTWDKPEIKVRLYPCRNCLAELNYDGYKRVSDIQRDYIVRNFDVKKFFEEYESVVRQFAELPPHTKDTIPKGGYTKDWAKISRRRRKEKKWTCECCGVNCSEARSLCHAHHKNGNRAQNAITNLKCLCVLCHSKQPYHSMKPRAGESEKIKSLRKEQGLEAICPTCKA